MSGRISFACPLALSPMKDAPQRYDSSSARNFATRPATRKGQRGSGVVLHST